MLRFFFFLFARLILAGIFLYAGLIKASSSAQFALTLIPFTIIPTTWIGPLSLILPIVEVLAAILLLLPWTKRLGSVIIVILCLLFISALGWALLNGIIVSCSCFGRDETPSAPLMIFAMCRDIVLAAVAGALLFEKRLLNRL